MDRYCRICYNTKDWCCPSGDAAKLELGKTYAVKHGFGHEEWLFDLTTLMQPNDSSKNVYKYGYLQPIGKYRNAYLGKNHNLFLYTVSPQREKLAVGIIRNLYVPKNDELEVVYDQANDIGLLDTMAAQAAEYQIKGSRIDFHHSPPDQIFNVRFSPDDLEVFGVFHVMPTDSPVYRSHRYHPLKADRPFPKRYVGDKLPRGLRAEAGDQERSEAVRRKCAMMGTTYLPQHVILQNKIYRYLMGKCGNNSVRYEENYVDLTLIEADRTTFFEIKIKASARACIREALGQLLEYCHYPSADRAQRLVVVGDKKPDKNDRSYMADVRIKYQIPIYYQMWDASKSRLSDLL